MDSSNVGSGGGSDSEDTGLEGNPNPWGSSDHGDGSVNPVPKVERRGLEWGGIIGGSDLLRNVHPGGGIGGESMEDRNNGVGNEGDEGQGSYESDTRVQWARWARWASDRERERRVGVMREIEEEERRERERRREWARAEVEKERKRRVEEGMWGNLTESTWFISLTTPQHTEKYLVVCPYSPLGCDKVVMRDEIEDHMSVCEWRGKDVVEEGGQEEGELICPYSIMGCSHCASRSDMMIHMQVCNYGGGGREKEEEDRKRWKKVVVEEMEVERERRRESDVGLGGGKHIHQLLQGQVRMCLSTLNEQVVAFADDKRRKSLELLPARQQALRMVCTLVNGIWGDDAQAMLYGSCATGLDSEHSDVDVVVCFKGGGKKSGMGGKVKMLATVMRELPWCRVKVAVENGKVPVVKATALVTRDGENVGNWDSRKGDEVEVRGRVGGAKRRLHISNLLWTRFARPATNNSPLLAGPP